MKTLVGAVLGISICAAVALAFTSEYRTRFITSATLTINVQDGQYLTIRNFTQDTDAPGQRGAVIAGVVPSTPTPTPSPTPTPTPFQTLSTNAGPGIALGGTLTDTATLSGDNNPTGSITFFLTDPSSSVVDIETVTVNGNGDYTTPNGFSPSVAGTYMWSASYSGDVNNSPATDNGQNETVVVTATPTPTPTAAPTPTPINAIVLTATLLNPPANLFHPLPTEFVKPIIIAGPATLTINPVPPATLAITYRKTQQSSPTPTPTASSTSATGLTSTSSATTTLSVGAPTGSSTSATTMESGSSDEDDFDSTPAPSPTPTPTSTPPPTPTPTPSITPNSSPTS